LKQPFLNRRAALASILALAGAGCTRPRRFPTKFGRLSSGIRYGYLSPPNPKNLPLLLLFVANTETALGPESPNPIAQNMARRDCMVVAIELPCHGQHLTQCPAPELIGWATIASSDATLFQGLIAETHAILDAVIQSGWVDPNRIAASGVSRGAYAAFAVAGVQPDIKHLAVFSPVTELSALSEFTQIPTEWNKIDANRLAGKNIWIAINNNDQRVGTANAVRFSQTLKSIPGNDVADVQCYLIPENGHAVSRVTFTRGEAWLAKKLGI
jgi:predicted esterase